MNFDDQAEIGAAALNNNINNNTVGYAVDQMNTDAPFVDRLGKILGGGFSGKGVAPPGSDNPLGERFYNSPPYIASHYTQLGKFFTNAEPGNFYTNRYDKPQKNKPTQSVDPIEFNNKWYQRMREFAQAEEIADKGQPQIRSR